MTEAIRVFVHGGVSGTRKERPSIGYALIDAVAVATAMDAVETAVRAMEDDPKLNAGVGSVLNLAGELELDAGIVDGSTGNWGGVANVRVRHPISLARRILESTPHVLVTGEGANALGRDMEQLESATDDRQGAWARARDEGRLRPERYAVAEHVDTVGAVALDSRGHLAAGSSTGGVFGKMPGRVGDAPIYGAGIYASQSAAVLGTGVGELFLETLAVLRAGTLVEQGEDPQSACKRVIEDIGRRSRVSAGLLALGADGRVGACYRGGMWAVEGPEGPVEAVRID